MKHLLLLASIAVSTLLTGCASVPMAGNDLDAQAKTFAIQQDKSVLYVYRNETFGAAVKLDVLLDDNRLGATVSHSYFAVPVLPGRHTLVSIGDNNSVLNIDTEAGQNYYIWQEITIGVLTPRTRLQVVSEAQGKAGVAESQLIASAYRSPATNVPASSTTFTNTVSPAETQQQSSAVTQAVVLRDAPVSTMTVSAQTVEQTPVTPAPAVPITVETPIPAPAPTPAPAPVIAPIGVEAPVPAVAPASAIPSMSPTTTMTVPVLSTQKIPFRAGISSATVERMAKQNQCTGGRGASLLTPPGPIEIYRMDCDQGGTFIATCELRQCTQGTPHSH